MVVGIVINIHLGFRNLLLHYGRYSRKKHEALKCILTEGDMNSVEEIQLIPEQTIAIYNKKTEPKVTP